MTHQTIEVFPPKRTHSSGTVTRSSQRPSPAWAAGTIGRERSTGPRSGDVGLDDRARAPHRERAVDGAREERRPAGERDRLALAAHLDLALDAQHDAWPLTGNGLPRAAVVER